MATNEEIIISKVLVVPTTPGGTAGGAIALTSAPVGTLVMSGAKMYVAVTSGTFEEVASS